MGQDSTRANTQATASWADLLGADLRSLALFRVAIALVVLLDLSMRAMDLGAHYTDAGVLRRSDLLDTFGWLHVWPLCVHLCGGALWSAALIFLIHAVFALAMLVGYRTRLATAVVWLLTMSVQLRNLYIGLGGDAELRLMLFWGCFVPLGACYSVDSVLNPSARPRTSMQYTSVGTVALFAQLIIMYLSTGYAKWEQPAWRDGSALALSFDDDLFVTSAGLFMLQFPALCHLLTHVVLALELVAPVLLFLPVFPGLLRTLAVAALCCMHFGFGIGLRIGIFRWVGIAAVLCFLPAWFWERLLARLHTPERLGVRVYVRDEDARARMLTMLFRTFFLLSETPIASGLDLGAGGFGKTERVIVIDHAGAAYTDYDGVLVLVRNSPLLWPLTSVLQRRAMRQLAQSLWERGRTRRQAPPAEAAGSKSTPTVRSRRTWGREGLCAIFLAFVVFWNLNVVRDPEFVAPAWIEWFGATFFLQQGWRMFATPSTRTGWLVIPGKLMDGREIDLFRGGGPVPDLDEYTDTTGVSWDKPAAGPAPVRSSRWVNFMDRLQHAKRGEPQLLFYGRYLCREWNDRHQGGQQLSGFELYWMARPVTGRAGHPGDEYERVLLWTHNCFG